MVKYFCDRCGKEVHKLTLLALKDETHDVPSTLNTIWVCHDCVKTIQTLFADRVKMMSLTDKNEEDISND